MEMIVYDFGKRPADSIDILKIVYAGSLDTLYPPEISQQCLAPFITDTRDAFQLRAETLFRPGLAMARNCEPVGFIPDLLDQVQGGAGFLEAQGPGMLVPAMINFSRPGLRPSPLATPTS